MCFLMVLASRPCATPVLAICCEYQTTDLFGRFFRKALYAFCQLAYLAWVSILPASRLTVLGVLCGSTRDGCRCACRFIQNGPSGPFVFSI